MKNIKIAISGELGSGKSVLSKRLSDFLGMEVISIGKIQRNLASKHGMTTLEFNKYLETHPEIDLEFDDAVTQYGLQETPFILDSRLAWHFVPASFKIHLLVDNSIAAQRIHSDEIRKDEKYSSIEEAKRHLTERKNSETIRFKQQYGVDIDDLCNYDIVIDTGYTTPEIIFEKVLEAFNKWKQDIDFNHIYFSPKSLIPTQGIRGHTFLYNKDISGSPIKIDCIENLPISIIKHFNRYFIYDGHKRASSAINSKTDLIPCIIIGNEKNQLPNDQDAREYLRNHYTMEQVCDWEALHDFHFPEYVPEFK